MHPVVDIPYFRSPYHPTRRTLELIKVRRLAGRLPVASPARVVPLPPLTVDVERCPVGAADHLIVFQRERVLVEHRAAGRQHRLVVEQAIELRNVPQPLVERVPSHGVPQRAWNLVVGERITNYAVAHDARGPRIVNLTETYRSSERVGAD